MGGNVVIFNTRADRIKIDNTNTVVERLKRFFYELNETYFIKYNNKLWNDNIEMYFTGSSYHLFNRKEEFSEYKKTIGDIDIQIDKSSGNNLIGLINTRKDLIGIKKTPGQYISLWDIDNRKIQIDFELESFDNGIPSEWSLFSRNSDWEDLKLGIKGVAHKLLLRSLNYKDAFHMYLKTKKTYKLLYKSEYAFSPTLGNRLKYRSIEEVYELFPVYIEIPYSQKLSTKNIKNIFYHFFNSIPNNKEIELFYSFVGCIELIKRYTTKEEKEKIVNAFVYNIFGKDSQILYRDNKEEDLKEKYIMFNYICENLEINKQKYTDLIKIYNERIK